MSTQPNIKHAYVDVFDGDRNLKFPLRKQHTNHLFSNIVVQNHPDVRFSGEHTLVEKSFGKESFQHPEQETLNFGMQSEGPLSFKVKTIGVPRRAVITFPQHRGFGGWLAPYAVFHGEKLGIDDCLYISFQEPYLTSGSYFLVDNEGNDPIPAALRVINRELHRYGLTGENATLIGSSKGANIAALVSRHFQNNQLILCNYSVDLNYRLRNNFLSYLADTFDLLDIKIPDALEILKMEAERKETHWLYTVGDSLANQGYESLTARRLTTYPCKESHGLILRGKWELIISLIEDFNK